MRTLVTVVIEPPLVPRRLWPGTIARDVGQRMPVVLDAVLDRVDLTQVIIDHVSIERILGSIDVEQILTHFDLAGLATKVVDDIDLPGIIRESTGTLASESVGGVRVQSASADDAIDRLVAHLIPGRTRATPRDN